MVDIKFTCGHFIMEDVMKEMVVCIWVCNNVRDEKFIHIEYMKVA